jgi:phage-related protein
MKPIVWCGTSLGCVRDFPDEARREVGHQLNRVQHGREPADWKSMTTVGDGVRELRIHAAGERRVLYVAKFADAVYVLHAFVKKTQRMPQRDLNLAATRYRALMGDLGRQNR